MWSPQWSNIFVRSIVYTPSFQNLFNCNETPCFSLTLVRSTILCYQLFSTCFLDMVFLHMPCYSLELLDCLGKEKGGPSMFGQKDFRSRVTRDQGVSLPFHTYEINQTFCPSETSYTAAASDDVHPLR